MKTTARCEASCLCLCHEGLGDVEHRYRPCYGKPGSTDVSDIAAPKCRCSHPQRAHGHDRKNRPTCFGSAMCGCTTYREDTK